MKLGIMSDSHGSIEAIKKAVRLAGEVDMWLHAGDCSKDIEHLGHTDVIAVSGNCDGTTTCNSDEFIEREGVCIWLTHGHRYKVKNGVSELLWWANQYKADIVVYGHTHIPQNKFLNGVLLFNPGSVTYSVPGEKPTFGILEIGQGKIHKAKIISLC